MNHIFISYSSQNIEYARNLADKLRDEGFDVWLDNRRLHSSEDWWQSIVLALRDCGAVVVILTPESDASRWVQREITLAEKYRKPLFPLLLDGDLNTPNWELFVRTQVEDVRGGILPPPQFYDFLTNYTARGKQQGAYVTNLPASVVIDATTRAEIANPPPLAELTIKPKEETAPESTRRQGARNGLVVFGAAGTLLVIALLIFNTLNASQQVANAPTPVLDEMSQTPTLTSTLSDSKELLATETLFLEIHTEDAVTDEVQTTSTAAQATLTASSRAETSAPKSTTTPSALPSVAVEGSININLRGGANIRSGPSTTFPVILTLTTTDTFTIIAQSTGWYLIQIPGNSYGWIRADLVTIRGSITDIATAVTIPAPPAVVSTSNASIPAAQTAIPSSDLPDLVISSASFSMNTCETAQVQVTATNRGGTDSREFSLKLTESMTGIILGETAVLNLSPGENIVLDFSVRPTRSAEGVLGTIDNKRQVREAAESNNSYFFLIPDSYFDQCF